MADTTTTQTPRPLTRTFVVFLGPLVLTNVLQALSSTLNNIYVGRLLGVEAMASAAGFFPVLLLLLSFVIGLGAGASVLAGQAWGAKDLPLVRRIAGTVMSAGLLLGVAIAVCGALLAEPLMRLLGTAPGVMPGAVAFMRAMMAALPLLFASMLASALLRGVGDTVTPLRTLLVSCAVTSVATPALITGWGGLPRLGVAGAGWATVLASAVSVAWMVWHLRRRGHTLAPGRFTGRLPPIDAALLRSMARIGIPTGLFFVTGSLADLVLLALVNSHGPHATAAWGVVNQVMAYVQFPALSIAIAASILAAQAIGAGQFKRVAQVTNVGLALNGVLTGGLAVLVAVFAEPLARIFINDPQVTPLAAQLLHITVWGSVLFGLSSVFSGVMRASGTVLVPTVISLGCLALLVVPLGHLLSRRYGLPGIWLAYPATYACALVLQAGYFYGIWKKRPIRKLV